MSGQQQSTVVLHPEQATLLQKLKIWGKLAKGDLHTISKKDVEDLFGVLDTEERGEISRDDLLILRQIPGLCLTSEDVENLVNDADKDNSGKVNQDELFKALTQGELAYNLVLAALGQKKAALKTTECCKEDLLEFLRFEYETKSSLWSLPQTLVLFMAFFVCMTAHLKVSTAFTMQDALLGEIEGEGAPYLHKYVHDVPTFWDWMESSFISALFKSGPSDLEIWPYPGRLASYNQIVGGVALTRVTSQPGVCLQSDTLRTFYDSRHGGRCHKQKENTKTTTEYIHYHKRQEDIRAQMAELRYSAVTNSSWVDQNTTSLSADMLLYNGHLRAFTMLRLLFDFNPSGAVKVKFEMETFLADPYNNILWIIPDIIFGVTVLRMFYSEMLELVPAVMNGIDGFQQYMQFWNVVDWFSIIVGVAVMTTWGLIVNMVSSDLQSKISALNMASLDDAVLTNRTYLDTAQFESVMPAAAYNERIGDLLRLVEDLRLLHMWLRIICFGYNFVLMMKFFKAFQANPRLNIVIKTMQTSAIDIIHFLIVFLVIFFVFSSASYVVFGSRMKEFSTQTKSMIYCWRILMGEFDVEAMEVVSPMIAYIWIVVFQFLVLQVLLNMLLAIIMDTYSAVNEPGAETIWKQIREALHTARETRGHLDMWYLICEFEDEDYQVHADRMTSKSLRSAFETQKMTKHNADYLIRKTAEYIKAKEAKSELKMSDAVRIISRMQTTGLRVQEAVEKILEMVMEERRRPQEERFDAIMAGVDPDERKPRFPPGGPAATVSSTHSVGNNRGATGFSNMGTGNAVQVGQQVPAPGQSFRHLPADTNRRRSSALSLSNNPANLPPRHPAAMADVNATGAHDDQLHAGLEQLQMTLDGIRHDQIRVESSLVEEVRDMRSYIEQRDAWLEQRLNAIDRRFEKVERAADRMTSAMQGFDYRELVSATERVAHFLQIKHHGLAAPSNNNVLAVRSANSEQGGAPLTRQSSFYEDEAPPEEAVVQHSPEPKEAGDGMSLAARQQMRQQLDRISEQVTQLISHSEDSADMRKLLWKMDLNVRQTKAAVQKIEEMGLRAANTQSSKPANLGEGFARLSTARASASVRSSPRGSKDPAGTPAGAGGLAGLRLPAVPDHND